MLTAHVMEVSGSSISSDNDSLIYIEEIGCLFNLTQLSLTYFHVTLQKHVEYETEEKQVIFWKCIEAVK